MLIARLHRAQHVQCVDLQLPNATFCASPFHLFPGFVLLDHVVHFRFVDLILSTYCYFTCFSSIYVSY